MGTSDTSSPTKAPSSDMCIPPGSNCFTKHSEAGCNDESCESKVCDVRSKYCNKKWNNKCKRKAEELCTPCECTEDDDALFFLKINNSDDTPVFKTCDWLKDQSDEKREKHCDKFASYEGVEAARFVCPLTCELDTCP